MTITYKGEKKEVIATNRSLFKIEKFAKTPILKLLSSIEQVENLEVIFYLIYSCTKIEDDFEEFSDAYKLSDLTNELPLVINEISNLFISTKKKVEK